MKDMKLLITGGSGFIGTNFIELLLANKIENFINVDIQKPLKTGHETYWRNCNIMDKEELSKVFDQFQPTHMVHLAARTDTASDKLEDYIENTEGTANVIHAIEKTESMTHAIITSTQYVYKSDAHPLPKNDTDFIPHTTYGISKKISEEMTQKSPMKAAWTIIRPTNVWGPWNMRYPNEFLKIIDKGWYFHPKNAYPVKSYAYVKNVVHQILGILEAPVEKVNRNVYYVGDYPMSSSEWINSFSLELTGKEVKTFPKLLLQLVSYGGDVVKMLGLPFPLHSARFQNMIDDYNTPMQKTIDAFGLSNPDLNENVRETIHWIKNEGKPFFKYWQNK